MSRIGKKPVPLGKAKVTVNDHKIAVEGPKGKLELNVHPAITVKMDNDKKELLVTRPNDEKQSKALHGLTRALLANMIEGVTNGYRKTLEIQGVGYKAEQRGKKLVLSVGLANQLSVEIPGDVTVALEGANKIVVTGADKQAVGQFAAQVRALRKPTQWPNIVWVSAINDGNVFDFSTIGN